MVSRTDLAQPPPCVETSHLQVMVIAVDDRRLMPRGSSGAPQKTLWTWAMNLMKVKAQVTPPGRPRRHRLLEP